MEQIKNQFDQATVMKILKGALIAGGASFVIVFLESVSQFDFGAFTEVFVAVAAILINSLKEYLKGK